MHFTRDYAGPLSEGRFFKKGSPAKVRTGKGKKTGALHSWQIKALQEKGFITVPDKAKALETDTGDSASSSK